MIDKVTNLPFYLKTSISLIGLYFLFTILYIAQGIIIPIVFAIVIAILLSPVVNLLVRIKINRIVAIFITLLLTFIIIITFASLLFTQASRFSDSWLMLVTKFTELLNKSIIWASGYLKINSQQINEWILKLRGELINIASASIGKTLLTIGSGLIGLMLLPVYIFLMLFYQPLILDFIYKLSGVKNKTQVSEIVSKTKRLIQHYLSGLVIEFVIIAILYTCTLLILGVDYAILIGLIGALINVIPYIGGFVGIALPMMIALVTKSSAWYAIYILFIFYIIQFFDNHYIIPKIVASKVKINALFAIIVVLVGNALWGIAGMFLSIPLLAIVKLIFDHIETLKPWGFLLGDTMPPLIKIKTNFLKKTSK